MPTPHMVLNWDIEGTKTYHTGVDRGVLYVANPGGTGSSAWQNGVAWQGLRQVSQSPDGADEQAFYADNIKYLSLRGVENFGGTIGCYDTPPEFDACDGTSSLVDSVGQTSAIGAISITQQPRLPFCFTYRTLKGKDDVGDTYGYLIHLVYNATAAPSSRDYQSVNETPAPIELSYEFKTTPINVGGTFRPTSHIVIDSTKFTGTLATKLETIEHNLYGWYDDTATPDTIEPHILLPADLLTIMSA